MAKIILVEDEINIASFIERGLREFGHEVSVVYDGNAGWELLQNESFDLLILDIIMPDWNCAACTGSVSAITLLLLC